MALFEGSELRPVWYPDKKVSACDANAMCSYPETSIWRDSALGMCHANILACATPD